MKILAAVVLVACAVGQSADAQTLTMSSQRGEYQVGETALLTIHGSSYDISSVYVSIGFDPSKARVVRANQTQQTSWGLPWTLAALDAGPGTADVLSQSAPFYFASPLDGPFHAEVELEILASGPIPISFHTIDLGWLSSAAGIELTGVAPVPPVLPYHGRLPSQDPTLVAFAIADAAGARIWGPELHRVTPDADGRFVAYLGATFEEGVPALDTLPGFSELVLVVSIEDGSGAFQTLGPARRLFPVWHASSATRLAPRSVAPSAIQSLSITTEKIAQATIQAEDVRNDTLLGPDLSERAIRGAHIPPGVIEGRHLSRLSSGNIDDGAIKEHHFREIESDGNGVVIYSGISGSIFEPHSIGREQIDKIGAQQIVPGSLSHLDVHPDVVMSQEVDPELYGQAQPWENSDDQPATCPEDTSVCGFDTDFHYRFRLKCCPAVKCP